MDNNSINDKLKNTIDGDLTSEAAQAIKDAGDIKKQAQKTSSSSLEKGLKNSNIQGSSIPGANIASDVANLGKTAVSRAVSLIDDAQKFNTGRTVLSDDFTGAKTVNNIDKQSTNPVDSIKSDSVGYGYNKYRTSSDSLQAMGQIAKDIGTSGFEESDAKQGYNKVRKGANLAGGALVGEALKASPKSDAMHNFYDYGSLQTTSKSLDKYGREANRIYAREIENHIATTGTGLDTYLDHARKNTGNLQRDFITQKSYIVQQLEAKKINAKTLSSKDIVTAVNTGKLNGIALDTDTKKLLLEYQNLKSMESDVLSGGGLVKGFEAQTKLLIKSSLQDSDAYTGARVASSTFKLGKGGLKAARLAGTTGALAITNAVNGIGTVSAHAGEKFAAARFRKTGDAKWMVRKNDAANKRIKINDKTKNAKYKIKDFRKDGIKGTTKKLINKTPVGKAVNNIRTKLLESKLIAGYGRIKLRIVGSKPMRVVKAPFKGLKLLSGFFKKFILIAGGILLILLCISAIATIITFPSGGDISDNMDTDALPRAEYSYFSQALEYVEKFKKAYEINLYGFEAGSPESEYGLLPGWGLYDYLPESIGFSDDPEYQSVNESPTATKKDAYPEAKSNVRSFSEDHIKGDEEDEVVGYDLSKYWGSKTFNYDTTVKWTIDESQEVNGVMESDAIRIYEGDVSLLSTAGILGKGNKIGNWYGRELGEWVFVGQESGGTNKFGHEITIFKYKLNTKLDEESDGYKKRPERALEYTEYDYNKVYTGAQFSEYYIKDDYEEALRLKKNDDGDTVKSIGEEIIIDTDYFFKDENLGTYYYQQGRKKNMSEYYASHYAPTSQKSWVYKGTNPSRTYGDQPNKVIGVIRPNDPELVDTNFELTPYYEADLFKNMLCLAVGILNNQDECQEFKNNYILQLYKKVAQSDYAKEQFDEIRKDYTADERNVFLCTYPEGKSGMHVFSPKIVKSGAGEFEENHPEAYVYCPGHPNAAITIDVAAPPATMDDLEDREDEEISYSWFSKGLLELRYWDCGIQDMMRLDMSKNIADKDLVITDNKAVHDISIHNEEHYLKSQANPEYSSFVYEVNDPVQVNYNVWDGFRPSADGTMETDPDIPAYESYHGWFTPNGDLTNQHTLVFDYSQYSINDWELMYEDFTFPDEFGYLLTSIEDILTGAAKLDPEIKENIMYNVIEEFYGTKTTMTLKKPLTVAEINKILSNITGIDSTQKALIQLALEAVGKIGYQWGGKASGPGWEAKFGSSTPDHKKRANGLDCSGFVQWLYMTAAHQQVPGSTGGYGGKNKIQYSQLKPGDVGLLKSPGSSDNHIGIYIGKSDTGEDLWVHCAGSSGVTLSRGYGFKQFYSLQ